MRKWLAGLIVLGVVGFFFFRKEKPVEDGPTSEVVMPRPKVTNEAAPTPGVKPLGGEKSGTVTAPAGKAGPVVAHVEKKKPTQEFAQAFVMDEGVAVVEGDVVIGTPVGDEDVSEGYAKPPPLRLWPSRVIPYHIQPDLPQPERVLKAIAMFEGTPIRFVEDPNPNDVLVFQASQGICKSYVGYVGGKQPVWVSPGCEAHEIAHEILHALGFIHEQNRTDRDQWVQVDFDSVDDRYKNNFEKLPADFMKVSGLTAFDFESIMIYPPSMFAKGGRTTMQSKVQTETIRPGEFLSPRDRERLQRAYPEPEGN